MEKIGKIDNAWNKMDQKKIAQYLPVLYHNQLYTLDKQIYHKITNTKKDV